MINEQQPIEIQPYLDARKNVIQMKRRHRQEVRKEVAFKIATERIIYLREEKRKK